MDYEEVSDFDLSVSVIYAMDSSLNDSVFYEEMTWPAQKSKAVIYDKESKDLVAKFDINNCSDWGKLMSNNNIDVIKIKIGEHKGKWSCRLSQKAISADLSIGRAIAICYLKYMDSCNGQ